ncbi:hypothetical protein RhiJN_03517 [Ceratobasidium sp. AG-Ba]|nr:hypothetical protein RhiJN_03517 [Ceratobasidium sp. AG-Ba]QRW04407.1 gEgh 16 protein [Ceratobasidium sp. AG-Ba]
MFSKATLVSVLFALSAISSVSAHGVLVAATGANGVKAQGFGVVESTPRDGTRRNPFQTDSSIIRDREIDSGKASACGRTLAGGVNDIAAQMEAAASAGMPSANADGTIEMTLHQVNGDGAGPYTCDVSTDGTGQSFVAMKVVTNVPGTNSRSNAKATDFPLVAQMPAGASCTGGPNGDACLVRCRNAARAGPFGGCVAVTAAGAGAATGAGTAGTAGTKATKKVATRSDSDDVSLEEADEALAEDLYKRALDVVNSFQKKRMLKTRIVGSARAGLWI